MDFFCLFLGVFFFVIAVLCFIGIIKMDKGDTWIE